MNFENVPFKKTMTDIDKDVIDAGIKGYDLIMVACLAIIAAYIYGFARIVA